MSNLAKSLDVQGVISVVSGLPQAEIEIEHKFYGGIYSRGGILPAGCLIVGRVHKTKSLNYLLKGSISISENGKQPEIHHAPCIFESDALTQKVGYTFDEVLMYNVFQTSCTDVESAEEELLYGETTKWEDLDDQQKLQT